MRKKIVIAGFLLLIISIILCLYGLNQYFQYKDYSENGSYIEIPSKFTKTEAKEQVALGTNISYIGLFLLIISIILVIIGVYIKEK